VSPASDKDQENALVFRVYALEGEMKTVDSAVVKLSRDVARHGEALGAQAVTLASHEQKLIGGDKELTEAKSDITQLARSVEILATKVSDSTNALTAQLSESATRSARFQAGFAITVAASAIAIILTGQPG
jgi:chromosome segregation ATPase